MYCYIGNFLVTMKKIKMKRKSPIEIDKSCLGCSYRTIEKSQSKEGNCKCYQEANRKCLMCVNCYGYICDRCVADVVPAINSKRKRYYEHCTACVEGLNYFNDNGKQPVDYIAPCCLLRVHRPPKLVFDNKRKNLGDRITSSPLGGSFVIPEFQLIVSTCFDSIDVLGLGREDNLNP